jgi:glycosyltransferase involved in cell wall biosynthesis
MKKVSIVVINYNDKLRVKRAIDSATNQTWKNTEVIVVDDGSDGSTREIYKDYTFFDSSAFKLIQLEKDDKSSRTPSRARNAGIKAATGEYICFLDSDNYFSNKFVEEMMKDPSDVMYCNWEILGIQKYKVNIEKVWKPEYNILQNYLMFTHLDHQAILLKKSLVEKIGCYDERLPRSQDCDFIVRAILETEKWVHIPKTLFFFEKHEQDQMKQYASIHGKTLWTLKNNINMMWLLGLVQRDPKLLLSFYQGINDFTTKKEWKDDYDKSEFKLLKSEHAKALKGERSEVV